MKDGFLIVFGGNSFYQYKLHEILENSFNGYVNEEYAFRGIRYYFPVMVEDGQYFFSCSDTNWSFYINGMPFAGKQPLKHGDFFKAINGELSFTFLIIDFMHCSFNAQIFSLQKSDIAFIGRAEEMNIILDYSAVISRKHAAFRVDADGRAFVDDLSGKAGVYVNGEKTSSCPLSSGDHIFIMGTTFIYYDNMLIIPSNVRINGLIKMDGINVVVPNSNDKQGIYVRTPRIEKTLETKTVEIAPPTSPQKRTELPFILSAGPSLTMSLCMLASLGVTVSRALDGGNFSSVITGGVMAVSMLLGALLWPKLTRNYYKRQEVANEEYRRKRYHDYLAEKEEELSHLYERNARIWNESLYPTVQMLMEIAKSKSRHLWERGLKDEDFLMIRLGTGNRPFEVSIALKKKGFVLEEDALNEEAYHLEEKYTELKNVPITLSLREHKVSGIVGDYLMLAKSLIINLVTLYAPEEVKIVLVYNRFQERELGRFNNLPHMWSSDRRKRYVASTKTEAYGLFSGLDEEIREREAILEKNDIRTPHFVVLVFDKTVIDNVPFCKNLVDTENRLGVSAVFFGKRFNQIPKECEAIIQKNDEVCGIYIKNENNNKFVRFEAEQADNAAIDHFISELSRIQVKEEERKSNVPESISFLDVYQVGNVNDLNISSHWNANASNRTLSAPIGVMAGGERFYLDIHEKYHGCHGLVAGTTGSGKSEFLQAYILSMMIHYSPKEVAFVLVDFKGGDMARPFLASPHLAATISNLSGNILYRALVSLEAEVKSRQKIFNESASMLGTDKIDINSYHKYYKEGKLKEALPHLIIVIDEFAQLKMQHPEFMAKLIDIAQVGRSLGIHLILATQKPSGVVDPQIWSNSRFRVCLKVMDKQDSSDMINRPVAAMIKSPGRAYVQVGYDEIFELVQSGFSGADYVPHEKYVDEDSITVSMVNWPGEIIREAKSIGQTKKTNLTQLEAVMKEMVRIGKEQNICARKLWLAPLPEQLLYEDVEKEYTTYDRARLDQDMPGRVVCGMVDLPHVQQQLPYTLDFVKDGHFAIYGASGTGKSTFVQAVFYGMAMKYSPEMFHSFVVDFNGGSLISLSKMPHCAAYVTDADEREVMKVFQILEQIIEKRREIFVESNCANYESYLKSGGSTLPVILAVVDNYAAFREKCFKCEDILVQLIASAHTCGICFLVTGNSKGAIYYKIVDHIKNKVVFAMNDAGSYRDILNLPVPVTLDNIKGRGLIVKNKTVVEMQVAVPYNAESEANRMQALNDFYGQLLTEFDRLMPYGVLKADGEIPEEEPEIPIYHKLPMKQLSPLEDTGGLVIGTSLKVGARIGFSYGNETPVFIANPVFQNKFLAYLVSRISADGFSVKIIANYQKEGIAQENYTDYMENFLAEYVASKTIQGKTVLIIDGFSDFYDVVSDATLDQFIMALKTKNVGQIITMDDMARIREYCDTELYLLLVKCPYGAVIGGNADNSMAVLLCNEFYSIPEEYRKLALETGQAIVYANDAAAYVQLGDV